MPIRFAFPHLWSPLPSMPTERIERRFWLNWLLAVGVAFPTALVLGAAILALLSMLRVSAWPWAKTEVTLLLGLFALLVLFATHLTVQQGRLMILRQERDSAQAEALAHVIHQFERLALVHSISRTLASLTESEAVYERIVDVSLELFPAEQVSVMVLDSAGEVLSVRAAFGHRSPARMIGAQQRVGEGIAGWVAQHQAPLLLGADIDAERFPGYRRPTHPPTAAMVVPILLRGELLGVLSVASAVPAMRYDTKELEALLTFAETAGICIRQAQQAEWIQAIKATLSQDPDGKMAA